MKSVRPFCLAATLAALLLANAGPARADDGIHRLWEGFSAIGNPVFQMVESFWRYVTGTDTAYSSRLAVEKEGTAATDSGSGISNETSPPPPGGGCIDPSGNPITCPANPKP